MTVVTRGMASLLLPLLCVGFAVAMAPRPVLARGGPVPVTSIQLDRRYLRLPIGGLECVKAQVLPRNATVQSLAWSVVGDSSCVSVNDGWIRALAPGRSEAVAMSTNGIEGRCLVEVFAQSFTDIAEVASRSDIEWLASRGVLKGAGDGSFHPARHVTAGEVLASFNRILGVSDDAAGVGLLKGREVSSKVTVAELLAYARATTAFATGASGAGVEPPVAPGIGPYITRGQMAPVLRWVMETIEATGIRPWGSLGFDIEQPNPNKGLTLSLADFGGTPGDGDSSSAFSEALGECRRLSAFKLVIPKGVYHISQPGAIDLSGMSDFVLDGQGSELVFSSVSPYIRIDGAKRLRIENLSMNWDWSKGRLATIGRVTAVGKGNAYFEMTFPEVRDVDPAMVWATMNALDPETLTPGVEGGLEWYWNGGLSFAKIEKTAPNELRLYPEKPTDLLLKVGQVYLIRHFTAPMTAVQISDTSNLTFKDVNLWSAPGIGFHGSGDTGHWQFLHCTVGLRPGASDRRVSTTADALHVGNSKGYLKVEDCDFSFMGDDAINIHDNNAIVLERSSENTLKVRGYLSPHVGDTIEIVNPDMSPLTFSDPVESFEMEPDACITLTLASPIPAVVGRGFIARNRRYDSRNYIIRNSYFHETRARGALLQAGNGLLEGCRFYRTQGAAILMESGAQGQSWSEGFGATNVVIRGNTFEKCNVNDWTALICVQTYLPTGRSAYPVFRDILVTQNTFREFPSRLGFLSSCASVTFSDNIVENATPTTKSSKQRGAIWVEQASGIRIAGNEWLTSPYMKGDMVTSSKKTAGVVSDGNRGAQE